MRSIIAMICTLASSITVFAGENVLTPGNILLNHFLCGPDEIANIHEYAPDGSLVTIFPGTGCGWIGCSITPDGRVVTTRRSIGGQVRTGVNIFDPDGTEVFTFDTFEIGLPGDVSVFSDGTIAVCDQGSNWIETYTVDVDNQTAVYTGPIAAPTGNIFIGSFVDDDDDLWATTGSAGNGIFQFSRTGEIVQEIVLPNERRTRDVIINRDDGNIWVTVDWSDPTEPEEILELASSGQIIGGFTSGPLALGNIAGIGEGIEGQVYVVWQELDEIRVFTEDGTPLNPIPIVDPQTPVFLTVVPPPPPLPGDWDEDGDVDLIDYKQFRQCARGPDVSASGACRTAFDFDNDLDVDHHDWWVFHQSFTGEILSANQNRDREGAAFAPPDKRIKRKRVELIPPAYPEVILDVDADPDSPEVIPRRK